MSRQDRPDDERRWGDPTRRTHLANERTYLAWWRTGLTTLAVGVGIGKLVPQLGSGGGVVLPAATGVCFALLGIFFILYGTVRTRRIRQALDRNEFSYPDARVLAVLAAASVVLGGLTIAVVLYEL